MGNELNRALRPLHFHNARYDRRSDPRSISDINNSRMATDLRLQCPLCLVLGKTTYVRGADHRRYYLCGNCSLIFSDPEHDLSPTQEKAFYLNHENSIKNPGYVDFLHRVIQPMLSRLDCGMKGLDYGCGPGPTLSHLLQRHGIVCEIYDPLFADHPLRPPYDFIFATECFEHFHHPEIDIRRISSLLKPGGLLGLMTERWTTPEQFVSWYYTRDPTHVCFYHERTLDFVCHRYGFAPTWMDESRVAILRREDQVAKVFSSLEHGRSRLP